VPVLRFTAVMQRSPQRYLFALLPGVRRMGGRPSLLPARH